MIITVIYYILLSFIFIFVVHNLYEYFKDNLTVPREKDLIHKPKETYNKIFETLNNNNNNNNNKKHMKTELKDFLKILKTKTKTTNTPNVIPQNHSLSNVMPSDNNNYTPF
jgi:DNA-binding transcriptional regulator GbsR (MarR family)